MDPLTLGADICHHVCCALDLRSLVSLSVTSRGWRQLIRGDEGLWRHLCARDQSFGGWQPTDQVPSNSSSSSSSSSSDNGSSSACSWRERYRHTHLKVALQQVLWESQPEQTGRVPRPREGHAACSWPGGSMLLFGGFCNGAVNDLHLLLPPPHGSTTPARVSSSSGGKGGSGEAASRGAHRWVQPKVTGRRPLPRYGHTLTRCGPNGEYALVFGGLLAGGYQVPLDTVAVLRVKPPAAGGAAAAAAVGDCLQSGGREDETSLGVLRDEEVDLPHGPANIHWWQGLMALAEGFDVEEISSSSEDELELEFGMSAADDAEHDNDSSFGGSGESRSDGSDDDGSDSWNSASSASSPAATLQGDDPEDEGLGEEGSASEGVELAPAAPALEDVLHAQLAAAAARAASSSGQAVAAATTAAAVADTAAGEAAAAAPAVPAAASPSRQQATAGSAAADAPAVPLPCQSQIQSRVLGLELEWCYPPVSGEPPGARGYHSAAVSEDGCKVYLFGGISTGGSCSALAVLDVTTWQFSCPLTSGTVPPPCSGHSSCVYRNRLWVVGGGSGYDLLRSGGDRQDVYCLDLATMEWSQPEISGSPPPNSLGKCHSAVLVGSRMLFFGGGMHTSQGLAWLDLDARAWGTPGRVLGRPPSDRMSATAVLLGDELLLFAGFNFVERELRDLHCLKLVPGESEVAAAAQQQQRPRRQQPSAGGFWRL